MRPTSAGTNIDDIIDAFNSLEATIVTIGAVVQEQGRQVAAMHNFLVRLQEVLGNLVSATLDTRQRLEALTTLVEAGTSATVRRPGRPAAPSDTFVIVRPLGRLGNRMIQHMVAMSIAAKVPGARISRVHLPEWGRDEREIAGAPPPQVDIDTMRVDVGALAGRMRRGEINAVAISGYVQNIGNFLDVDAYRATFVGPPEIVGYGPKVLLISLRMNEILSAEHPPYVLLPIAFYRQLIEETGLRPVFFGQLTPSPYLDELKASFPAAAFVQGRNPVHDFETIRRSKNIVVSISTFAWLAAWLSEAQRIFLPLAGLFNPMYGTIYEAGHDLVPREDARYRLFLFPLGVAVDQSRLPAYHAAIDGMWREVTSGEIDDLLAGQRLAERSFEKHVALFDEEFYQRRYPEIKTAIGAGLVKSGRDHYELHGFREARHPFEVDLDYMIHYPDVGLAISNGEFTDPYHFHAERGHALGYARTRLELNAASKNELAPPRTTRKRKV
jgi:hypothetical protein